MWKEKEVSIKDIENLLQQGYQVEVDSPDGYVPVNFFIDKGMWAEYVLKLDDPQYTPVRCNENHLFETDSGWQSAKDLHNGNEVKILTDNGYINGKVYTTGKFIPIVDINVNHENHRYYANRISSHNTGVGKSLFMCHHAASCLAMGKNVLYITMEMAEERIAERIDANLMNVPMTQLKNIPKNTFNTKIEGIVKRGVGKLIIKEYPTSSAHSGHFRALLNELKLKKDFAPDIIFIDYLNICASSRVKSIGGAVNSYTYVKSIAEELRGLSLEFNLPIFTATQTNRTGFSNSDVEITDTSESFGLPQTCDLLFALISTEELEQMDQIMVKQLKNRYNDPSYYKRFLIGIDRSKMKLYDVEENAQSLNSDVGSSTANRSSDTEKFKGFKV